MSKRPQFFVFQNHIKICALFNLNCTQKIHQNNVDLSSIEIRSKKVNRNDVNILLFKVTPNKLRQNDVDFLLIEITSKKLHQSDVDFLPIEITPKKYVKMMWKFISSLLSMYRRIIDIKSMSIGCGVSVA